MLSIASVTPGSRGGSRWRGIVRRPAVLCIELLDSPLVLESSRGQVARVPARFYWASACGTVVHKLPWFNTDTMRSLYVTAYKPERQYLSVHALLGWTFRCP